MHDETIFNANDGERFFWGMERDTVISKKSMGSGIMVSDFVNQQIGYLGLTNEQWVKAKKKYPLIPKIARFTMEYGKNKQEYFESTKFLQQVEGALQIASFLWPDHDHIWVFDHSGVHKRKADDALNVSNMNLNDGGKQQHFRSTVWTGEIQYLVHQTGPSKGEAKGLRTMLQERGLQKNTMLRADAVITLGNCVDFKNKQTDLEKLVSKFTTLTSTHSVLFLPKFHCKFNSIELVQATRK